jgi:hypothetical protein
MRSELVFDAMKYVSNRFLLTQLASQAVRKFHRPNTRIEETANEIFERFSRANPIVGVLHNSNLQPFPPAVQGKTDLLGEDLEQSVA